jgi:hypothetical protein
VSVQAIAYAVELKRCPDGSDISARQKCLLLVLANYHNTAHKVCWPSIPLLAEQSHSSMSQTKRDLRYFRDHRVLDARTSSGRGHLSEYKFIALDGMFDGDKRVQGGPFYSAPEKGSERVHGAPEKGSERVHGAPEKGSERVQNDVRNKERTKNRMNQEPCVGSAEADPRHTPLREAIVRLQLRDPKVGYEIWDVTADKVLRKMLAAKPGISIEKLIDCIVNRWLSPHASPSDHPRYYVAELTDFQAGPKNRYRDLVVFDAEDARQLREIAAGVGDVQEVMPLEAGESLHEQTLEISIANPNAADWNGLAPADAWKQVLGRLSQVVARHTFDTWLKPTRGIAAQGDTLIVSLPTPELLVIGDRFREQLVLAVLALGLPCSRLQLVARGDA